MKRTIILASVVVIITSGSVGIGGTIYVDADASGADNGTSWADAYNYLQDALADANSGDEIWVAQGIYTPDSSTAEPNGSGDRDATFELISGVALRGGYAGDGQIDPDARDVEGYETILSGDLKGDDVDNLPGPSKGDNSKHVVTGGGIDSTAVLDGFTITGGAAIRVNGGGMYNYEGNPTVLNCTFTGNLAWRCNGGGMYNYDSNPTVINCRFIGNWAAQDEGGGGMMNDWYSEPNIVNCTFRKNSTDGYGGGIHNYHFSSSRMTNCDVSENTAGSGGGIAGGGIVSDMLTNCTISGNSAGSGGGMMYYGFETNPTLDGCIISGNYASGFGGGMHNSRGSVPKLKNCTISGNSADWGGGGVCNYFESSSILTNCTISGNYGYYGGGIYEHEAGSYIETVVANCILWGNEAVHGTEINRKNSYGYFLVSYSDVQGGQADIYNDSSRPVEWLSGNTDADPCFVEPGYWADANDPNIVVEPNDPNGVWVDGDYRLLEGSPCIDAGDPNYAAGPNETDLDGNPRVIDGRIDMGAYEYESVAVPAIEAVVKIRPRTLNLRSKGRWIMCVIRLPEDYNVGEIDVNSILLEDEVEAERVWLGDEFAVAKFSRRAVQELLGEVETPAEVELVVSGELSDGTIFEGTDTIRVIDKGKGRNNLPGRAGRRVVQRKRKGEE